LNYKTVLVLLFVVVVNIVVSVLLWRLDGFVHVDLYGYGLVFSYDWANEYWDCRWMLWIFLAGSSVFAAISSGLHYLHSNKRSRLPSWGGFFVPVCAMVCQALGVMCLSQINGVVWNKLYDYGVNYDIDWAAT